MQVNINNFLQQAVAAERQMDTWRRQIVAKYPNAQFVGDEVILCAVDGVTDVGFCTPDTSWVEGTP